MSYHFQILAISLIGLILFKGCDKAPKYKTPPETTPPSYKEITPEKLKETDNCKFARPKDDVIRGNWWEIFNDPQLNALEEQVNISNQNIALADANFRAARAVVKGISFGLFSNRNNQPLNHKFAAISCHQPI